MSIELRIQDTHPPRKALYLLSTHPQHIDSDNTRLLITTPETAPRPYPLNRLSRILSGPNTQWQGRAIAACLSRNIPIIFLNQHHTPVGDAHPHHSQGGSLHQHLQHYLDLPDWHDRYQNWHKSRRMNVLNTLRDQRLITQNQLEQHKRQYAYQNTPDPHISPQIRAYHQSLVQQQLSEHHSRPRYWGSNGQPLELAAHLADLLNTEYHLSHPQQPTDPKTHYQQLENSEPTPRLHSHLADLHKHITQEINACH